MNDKSNTTFGSIEDNNGSPRRVPKKYDHEIRLSPTQQRKLQSQSGKNCSVTLAGDDRHYSFYKEPVWSSRKDVAAHGEMSYKITKLKKPVAQGLEKEVEVDIITSPREAIYGSKTDRVVIAGILGTKVDHSKNSLPDTNKQTKGKYKDAATQENGRNLGLVTPKHTFRRGQSSVLLTSEDRNELKTRKLTCKLEEHMRHKPTPDCAHTLKGVELTLLVAHDFNHKIKSDLQKAQKLEQDVAKAEKKLKNYYAFIKNSYDDSFRIEQKASPKRKQRTNNSPIKNKRKAYIIPMMRVPVKVDRFTNKETYMKKLEILKAMQKEPAKKEKKKEELAQPVFSNPIIYKANLEYTRKMKKAKVVPLVCFNNKRRSSVQQPQEIKVKMTRRKSCFELITNQQRAKTACDTQRQPVFAFSSEEVPECLSPFRFPSKVRSPRLMNASISRAISQKLYKRPTASSSMLSN